MIMRMLREGLLDLVRRNDFLMATDNDRAGPFLVLALLLFPDHCSVPVVPDDYCTVTACP